MQVYQKHCPIIAPSTMGDELMTEERAHQTDEIVKTIKKDLSGVFPFARDRLDAYTRILSYRRQFHSVADFLASDRGIRLLRDTLVAWGMNQRRASIKPFPAFRESVIRCKRDLVHLEACMQPYDFPPRSQTCLKAAYNHLHVMQSKAKMISNAMLLHFLFPELLMPMNGADTLSFFYGKSSGSLRRYLEIVELSFQIMRLPENWNVYLDNEWNATIPKLIDNAVIVLHRRR